MNHVELSERIQTVLDGLATPDEERELEQLLARDPQAQVEFVHWQRMFVALGRVPQASPPEGLVASVSAAAAARRSANSRDKDQPFESIDVIGYEHPERRASASWFETKVGRHFRSGSPRESGIMSEQQQSVFGNRKLWAGGAVAVLAVGVALVAFDLPPKSGDVVGTIAPAERYRAPDSTEAVKLGDQTVAQLMQNDTFDRVIKDPQMKALSQDAGIRVLAQVLSRSPEASRLMLANIESSRAASENVALAQAMLGNVEASRAELAAIQAERLKAGNAQETGRAQAAAIEAGRMQTNAKDASRAAAEAGRAQADAQTVGRAELANMMAAKLEASQAILANVDASRAAVQNVAVARAVLSNVQASRMLLSNDAGRAALGA
ncbi:MAG: hypothetical protein ABIV63_16565, partial [Caldimonas sp.]